MAAKRGGARANAGSAVDAARELFLAALLPPDRKLRYFEQQPLRALPPGRAGDRALLLMLVEDGVKKRWVEVHGREEGMHVGGWREASATHSSLIPTALTMITGWHCCSPQVLWVCGHAGEPGG
jgi:hypothetical protein